MCSLSHGISLQDNPKDQIPSASAGQREEELTSSNHETQLRLLVRTEGAAETNGLRTDYTLMTINVYLSLSHTHSPWSIVIFIVYVIRRNKPLEIRGHTNASTTAVLLRLAL